MAMHPLLARQLRRLGLEHSTAPASTAAWQQLLERVSRSYLECDLGLELLERSIALSSKEMQAAGDKRGLDAGVEIAVRTIKAVRPYCDGVHVMAIKATERLPEILTKAELG